MLSTINPKFVELASNCNSKILLKVSKVDPNEYTSRLNPLSENSLNKF